jgi:hypothetical protein
MECVTATAIQGTTEYTSTVVALRGSVHSASSRSGWAARANGSTTGKRRRSLACGVGIFGAALRGCSRVHCSGCRRSIRNNFSASSLRRGALPRACVRGRTDWLCSEMPQCLLDVVRTIARRAVPRYALSPARSHLNRLHIPLRIHLEPLLCNESKPSPRSSPHWC